MIRLIKIMVVLALVWSAWWYGSGYLLRHGITTWFDSRAEQGWRAELADITTSGYPLRHFTLLSSPALADPATGTAWQADWLMLDSPAAWPGYQSLHFAPTPQRLSYFDQTVVIEARDMVARLHLQPGLALTLKRMQLSAGQWQVDGDDGPVMSAASLVLAMVQGDTPETYRFDIDATEFTPGLRLRQLIGTTHGLPASFETLTLDMKVTFDHAWDRKALEARRPQPVAIDLELAELHWGTLRVMAAGGLTVDGNGIPTGAITVKVENWREMLAMARAAGGLAPQAVDAAERALNFLARLGGNRNSLDVQLNLVDGFIALGPIPLGPAPRLILR